MSTIPIEQLLSILSMSKDPSILQYISLLTQQAGNVEYEDYEEEEEETGVEIVEEDKDGDDSVGMLFVCFMKYNLEFELCF